MQGRAAGKEQETGRVAGRPYGKRFTKTEPSDSNGTSDRGTSGKSGEGREKSGSSDRLKWSPELHDLFLKCVDQLGGPSKAKPKEIIQLMQVDGLTLNHVKSHLQKHRNSTRASETRREEIKEYMRERNASHLNELPINSLLQAAGHHTSSHAMLGRLPSYYQDGSLIQGTKRINDNGGLYSDVRLDNALQGHSSEDTHGFKPRDIISRALGSVSIPPIEVRTSGEEETIGLHGASPRQSPIDKEQGVLIHHRPSGESEDTNCEGTPMNGDNHMDLDNLNNLTQGKTNELLSEAIMNQIGRLFQDTAAMQASTAQDMPHTLLSPKDLINSSLEELQRHIQIAVEKQRTVNLILQTQLALQLQERNNLTAVLGRMCHSLETALSQISNGEQ